MAKIASFVLCDFYHDKQTFKKLVTQCSSVHEAEHPELVLWDNLERQVGREVGGGFRIRGTHVYLWTIHVGVWQKPSQYCKVIIHQLK